MVHPSTSFRFDPALLARVDAYARLLSEARGIRVSRHAAMAELLTFALDTNDKVLRGRNAGPKKR